MIKIFYNNKKLVKFNFFKTRKIFMIKKENNELPPLDEIVKQAAKELHEGKSIPVKKLL